MLGDALIALGLLAGLFVLLDVFIGDGQKKWLEDKIVRLWDRADARRRSPTFEALGNARLKVLVSLVMGVIVPTLYERFLLTIDTVYDLRALFMTMTAVASSVTYLSLTAISVRGPRLRTLAVLSFVSGFCVVVDTMLVLTVAEGYLHFGFKYSFFVLAFALLGSVTFLVIFTVLFSVALMPRSIELVGEYTLRRIAEYPKGPILAGSAIVTALGLITKALLGK